MDRQEVINTVSNIIEFNKGIPNPRAAEIAAFCRMVVAGVGEDEYVGELRPHENAQQKKQRVRVYHSLSKYASTKILNFINRLASVEDVKKSLGFSDKDKDKEAIIASIVNNFYDEKSLLDWLIELYVTTQGSDPNALLLLTPYQVTDANNAAIENRVLPTIIPSSDVISKIAKNGRVDSAIRKISRNIQFVEGQKKNGFKRTPTQRVVNDYYYYADGLSMVFIFDASAMDSGADIDLPPFELNAEPYEIMQVGQDDEQSETYKVYTFENSYPCPVFRLSGRIDDKDPSVFTSILMNAENQFKALISRVSELGAAIECHTFPQKIIVVPQCMAKDEHGNRCDGGKCGANTCKSCGGSGKSMHLGSQDIITITISPDATPADIPNIQNMIHYAPHDEYAPEFLKQEIKEILGRIGDATFETNIFASTVVAKSADKSATPKNGVSETATKTNIDWQKMYMSLKSDALQLERIWPQIVRYVTAINFSNISVTPKLTFAKDFNFLTVPELIAEYAAAVSAGLPFGITKKIMQRIIEKQTPDETESVKWELFGLEHKPFADKTSSEIATILLNRGENDYDRVLWENFDSIMDKIRFDTPLILTYDFKKQCETIRKAVSDYAATIDYSQANDMNTLFANTPE